MSVGDEIPGLRIDKAHPWLNREDCFQSDNLVNLVCSADKPSKPIN